MLRCAVYTRKSTEDGLEQEFNSLDAQYEACVAYALSQRHEGWALVPARFDDGGFSGGSMKRPGLQRLLADVAAGKVDVILVYKIDRLTRSLADFAKIVEVLDKAGASFVSITQSFNTTTSMGRLTLNMLLSFAQFEREVTGERIRDKIAASKRKGLWMGGPVPLGYRVENRKLLVDDTEAELVRHIFTRYLASGSVLNLADELNRQGHRTKVQQRTSGPHRGGCEFRRGTLYHMLSNRIYRGELVHKGQHFPAEHPAIVPKVLWDDVQALMKANACGSSKRVSAQHPSLLVKLVYDGQGRPMTPSHSTKVGRRHRYYVTRPDMLDGSPAWRVSGHDLEKLVCERLSAQLSNQQFLCGLAGEVDTETVRQMLAKADLLAATMRSGSVFDRAEFLASIVARIDVLEECIELTVDPAKLGNALGVEHTTLADPLVLLVAATKVRHGHQLRLVISGPQSLTIAPTGRDERLVALVAEAHAARKLVLASPEKSIAAIAASTNRCRTRLGKLAVLACLAPDIVAAVIEGRQPATLTSRTLQDLDLPLGWRDQRALLGFG